MSKKETRSFVILDNVNCTYRHYRAERLKDVVDEINRCHTSELEGGNPVAIDDLIGIPPRYQIIAVNECYSLYE